MRRIGGFLMIALAAGVPATSPARAASLGRSTEPDYAYRQGEQAASPYDDRAERAREAYEARIESIRRSNEASQKALDAGAEQLRKMLFDN